MYLRIYRDLHHIPVLPIQRRTRQLITLLVGIFLIFVATGIPIVHAASPTDPLVVIATDLTNQDGLCTETFDLNIRTSLEKITHITCPIGSIVGIATIRKSQALLLHEAYIVQNSALLSSVNQKMVAQEIGQLIETKAQKLQHSVKNRFQPQTTCGSSSSVSLQWGRYYTSTEQYYKTSDCRYVELGLASIHSISLYPFNYSYWGHDQYQGGSFDVPDCPYLNEGHTYSHSVDQLWTPGYYYENWLYVYSCGTFWSHNDLGPLN